MKNAATDAGVNQALLKALIAILGAKGFLQNSDDCEKYVRGARYGEGRALAVLRPDSHEQVEQVVRLCAQFAQAIVLQGANTGLVAASTPDDSGRLMVLSLERLKKHLQIDPVNRSVEVDAGYSLQELNDALLEHGLFFPIDLGANPSIGGMIAANTGGARLIKYGDVRHNLLGLRAVLMHPAGDTVDAMKALRKNNTGPDLKQIFVGSSGAYGIITRAVLQVHRLPQQSATALIVPRDQAAVLTLLQHFEQHCGDFLSAFEGISGAAFASVIKHIPGIANPFAPEALPDYCVLLELSSSADPVSSGLQLEDFLTRQLEVLFGDVIDNAIVGRGKDLWRIRHAISEALRHEGKMIAFDISMPRSALVAFREQALAILAQDYPYLKAADFGHWADGGCHFNLIWPHDAKLTYDVALVQKLRTQIYDLVVHEFQGSFSAEHGVGPYNLAFYHRYVPRAAQNLAGQMQALLDPQNLLGLTRFAFSEEPN